MCVSALEFWLSSLDLSLHYSAFLDNGYDDLEICKKVGLCSTYRLSIYLLYIFQIGPGDLTCMGVTCVRHRTRIMAAVAELVLGGATQVYIRAAQAGWRILGRGEEEDSKETVEEDGQDEIEQRGCVSKRLFYKNSQN